METKLHLGNCVEVLSTLEDKSVDLLFADPPYGIGLKYDGYDDTQENLQKLIAAFMPQALRVAKVVAITPGINNIQLYPRFTWCLCWRYPGGIYRSQWGFNTWQPVMVYGPDPYLARGKGCRADSFEANVAARESDHPCPKPTPVMRWIINRCSFPGAVVLDPFMGSGTTGIATAELGGRSFIGIEQSPKYFEIAKRDIEESQKQPNLMVV